MHNKDKHKTKICILSLTRKLYPSCKYQKIIIVRGREIKIQSQGLPWGHVICYILNMLVKNKNIMDTLPSSGSRQRLYTATGLLILWPCLFDCLGGACGGDADKETGSGNVASGGVRKICHQSTGTLLVSPEQKT